MKAGFLFSFPFGREVPPDKTWFPLPQMGTEPLPFLGIQDDAEPPFLFPLCLKPMEPANLVMEGSCSTRGQREAPSNVGIQTAAGSFLLDVAYYGHLPR